MRPSVWHALRSVFEEAEAVEEAHAYRECAVLYGTHLDDPRLQTTWHLLHKRLISSRFALSQMRIALLEPTRGAHPGEVIVDEPFDWERH